MASAKEELTAYWMRNDLNPADFDMAIAHGQRRYEEARCNARHAALGILEKILGELQSGAIEPLDAVAFGKIVQYVRHS